MPACGSKFETTTKGIIPRCSQRNGTRSARVRGRAEKYRGIIPFILLVAAIMGIAVWFSPLARRGAMFYENNEPVGTVDGVCYGGGSTVRYDFDGSIDDLYSALEDMRADIVETVAAGNATIVYAVSDRVASGGDFNVMAAYRDGHIAIGTPILQGSY